MKKIRILNLLMLGGLAAGLTACATSESPLMTGQNPRARSGAPYLARSERTITFAKAIKGPAGCKGANVAWGGRVTRVVSDPNKGTELVVSEIPLFAPGHAPV